MNSRVSGGASSSWILPVVILVGFMLAGTVACSENGSGEDSTSTDSAPDVATASPETLQSQTTESEANKGTPPDTSRTAAPSPGKTSQPSVSDTAADQQTSPVDTITGVVRRVGSTPFARTVVEGTDTVTVTGSHESEIARLSGARVQVIGPVRTGEFPGPTVQGEQYTILSVAGEKPVVGRLRTDSVGFYLDLVEGGATRLRNVPPSFQQHIGAKLWAITSPDGTVRRYGVLRPMGGKESG